MFWKSTKTPTAFGRIDLSKATFIIPIRLESDDRVRNLITSLSYILANTKTTILIHESDSESRFETSVRPRINELLATSDCLLHYHFELSNDPLFHRQRILNDMIVRSETQVIVNYDCDVLLPLSSYSKAYKLIDSHKADVVYPYGDGDYQWQVFADDQVIDRFITSKFDLAVFEGYTKRKIAKYGFCQFVDRDSYIKSGLENENFISYAPEDFERHHRFKLLGYKVRRVKDVIYHLEHSRTDNSSPTNPRMKQNNEEWENIQKMNRTQLWEYISSQSYYKRRVDQIKKDRQ